MSKIYLFFIALLLLFVGCSDKPKAQKEIKEPEIVLIETNLSKIDTFVLSNIQDETQKVTISNKKVIFHTPQQGILLINLFASWCKPCMDNIEYINILQQKYSKDVFVAGVSVNDDINSTKLQSLIDRYKIDYFVSNSPSNNSFANLLAKSLQLPQNHDIPLVAIFVEVKYFAHYEGRVPIEMIEYDIKEAIKEL